MRLITIIAALAALPQLAAAQDSAEEGSEEGDIIVIDHAEAEAAEDSTAETSVFVEVEVESSQQQHEGSIVVEEHAEPAPAARADLTVPAPPQVDLRTQQRQLLRQRLREQRLGGPIAMLAVGLPVAVIFSYGAYLAWHVEEGVDCVLDDCASPNRTATTVLGAIAGVGLVLGVVGLVKLIKRVGARAEIRRQYEAGELATFDGALIRF